MRTLFKIAFRNILRNKRRTTTSAFIIGVGLLFFIFMDSIMAGMDKAATDNMIQLSTSSVKIHTPQFYTEKNSFPFKYEITNSDYCKILNYAQQNNLITLPSIINQSSGKIIVKNTQGLQQELFIINNDKPNYLNIREIYFNNNTFNVKNGKENKPVLINWYGAVFYCNMLSRIEGYSELYNLNNDLGVSL